MRSFAADEFRSCSCGKNECLADFVVFQSYGNCNLLKMHSYKSKAYINSRIGFYGYADMGLFSCSYNRPLAYEKLGIDIEDYAGLELQAQMAAFSDEEVAAAVAEIEAAMKEI